MPVAKPKNAARERIKDRLSKGLCIIQDCPNKFCSRGLCKQHFNEFHGQTRRLSSNQERAEFESKAIEEGLVLANGQQRGMTATGLFASIAAEVKS